MKRIVGVCVLILVILNSNAAFAQEVQSENLSDLQLKAEEQFAKEEAQRDLKKTALEVEKANTELEALRLEVEGSMAEDVTRAQKETDAMSQELARELLVLYGEADKESKAREKELKEEEIIRKQEFKAIEQMTQELNKDLKRIKLRPPRP
ncbi:MAG: hypothetical protein KAS13_05240 [Candidatus Omnitrophica bacterium]|nr:hypothetical protein [Candidatus Omnitrophota bacterium]